MSCIYDLALKFSKGLAKVFQDGKCGYINTKGKVVLPCNYDVVGHISEGLALVKQNDKWSVMNTEGKVIVTVCNWDSAHWSKVEM